MTNTLHMKHTLLMTTLLSTFSFGVSASELDLKPISNLDNTYKLAKICFLPDCQDDGIMSGDINIDINTDSKWCEKKGFTYYSSGTCSANTADDGRCERDKAHYIKCTKGKWCKNAGFTIKASDCRIPEYPDQQCQGLDLYKQCKRDDLRACKELNPNYATLCSSGWQVDPNNTCPYSKDKAVGICCNKCSGYEYMASNVPAGYEVDQSCTSCSGVKYIIKAKACSGYQVCRSGCMGQGSSCQSGSAIKHSSCQCDPCPGYSACGGSWQYCKGSTCPADSSRCSVSCPLDMFPNSCSNSSYCSGKYRNGYCSGTCNVPPPPPANNECSHQGPGRTWDECNRICGGNPSPSEILARYSCITNIWSNQCGVGRGCYLVYPHASSSEQLYDEYPDKPHARCACETWN